MIYILREVLSSKLAMHVLKAEAPLGIALLNSRKSSLFNHRCKITGGEDTRQNLSFPTINFVGCSKNKFKSFGMVYRFCQKRGAAHPRDSKRHRRPSKISQSCIQPGGHTLSSAIQNTIKPANGGSGAAPHLQFILPSLGTFNAQRRPSQHTYAIKAYRQSVYRRNRIASSHMD